MIKEKYTIRDFTPLLTIFFLIFLVSIIIPYKTGGDFMMGMRIFMGGFFVVFGLLKLIKLKDFAEAYQMYDIIAMRFKVYAYLYPFIELTLGIFFLVNFMPLLTNWLTLIVMSISAVGVYLKLRQGEEIMCACLGTVFKVPMTWVTLAEDLLMALMAVVMIFFMQGSQGNSLGYDLTKLPSVLEDVKEIRSTQIVELKDGDVFDLEASIVRQEVGNRTIKRLAYNGQIPGPVIKVEKNATITVNLTNNIDVDTTLHSHGLRLDNAFDGVPGVTQDPIKSGETFTYTLTFPDEGVYWYHPHIREDYTQELGLYGNFIVEGEEGYWSDAGQEEYLIFDDFLENGKFYDEEITHTLMGRFGDRLLINDQEDFRLEVEVGQINRFFLTNVANTRVFDLEFEGSEIKLVGGDVGRIQREEFIDEVIIAPAERYVVETLYPEVGTYNINHRGKKIGEVIVKDYDRQSKAEEFKVLRDNRSDYDVVLSDFANILSRQADRSLRLTIDMNMMEGMRGETGMNGERMMSDNDKVINLMGVEMTHKEAVEHCQMMPQMAGCEPFLGSETNEVGHAYGIEWEDNMVMMNQASTDKNTKWRIIDEETGKVNMDIDWAFHQGDLVKVSVFNDPNSVHPMQHPIHFHGQRFVVLARDGVANDNLQWKDTVLIPTGETVDLLVEMSNLGTWMTHCHIAEHLHAGMMFGFNVLEE